MSRARICILIAAMDALGAKFSLDAPIAIEPRREPPELDPRDFGVSLGPQPNKYKPHQGKREMERRAKQVRK